MEEEYEDEEERKRMIDMIKKHKYIGETPGQHMSGVGSTRRP